MPKPELFRVPGRNKANREAAPKTHVFSAVVERIARGVLASAEEVDGRLACPDRSSFHRINLALDYGQTGVMMGLAIAGRYLEDEEIYQAAKKVADYIAERAVPEGGGLKFAQFHPLPKQARDR